MAIEPTTGNQVCVIIGASHAGVNLAFSLRREGWEGAIILYDSDKEFPYHRPPLSKAYITESEDTEHSLLFPRENYDSEAITLSLGLTVNGIDRSAKTITLSDGSTQPYNKLVIATGARPLIPPIKGIEIALNLFPLRTGADAMSIKKALSNADKKRVVVIGGGYIGLEIAASMKKLGAKVVVLEREKRILARVTAPVMSDYFMDLHHKNGVDILTDKNVVSIDNQKNHNMVYCADGSSFEADVLVVGVGIRVNTELASGAGLEIENGIKVNSFARTNDEDIYAVGDCTFHYNPYYGRYVRLESVQNAVDQAKVAAASICGKNNIYDTIPWFWSDQYNVKLQMVGLSQGYNDVVVRSEDPENLSFSVWYFKDDDLLSVDAVNNGKAYVLGTKFLKEKQKIDKSKLRDTSIPMKPTSFI
tara:strand:- start:1976 stop:3229 length:1254 start_codon:yes stop_codon:yes gene_type:complete